jgi:Arc/MetJ-type ribon-helix-helix transcriptional regulator
MARFVVTLSEEHRALLEAARVKAGHRSHADTVRALIEATEDKVQARRDRLLREIADRHPEERDRPDGVIPVTKADMKALAEPFKTRLKGEWKAP